MEGASGALPETKSVRVLDNLKKLLLGFASARDDILIF